MPLNIDFLQILLHMLNFVILTGGLTLILFRPVNGFLTKRQEYYARLEQESLEKSEQAEALQSEYTKRLADAEGEIEALRANAEKEMADVSRAYIDKAKEKANAIVASAEQEAEARKEQILDSAQTEIGELVITATQKLLSDTVTPERNAALYDEFIRLADSAVSDKRNNNED